MAAGKTVIVFGLMMASLFLNLKAYFACYQNNKKIPQAHPATAGFCHPMGIGYLFKLKGYECDLIIPMRVLRVFSRQQVY
jgi:hypothetical protein